MSFIAWNDRLMVGVPVIDLEHKRLIGTLNDLYDAIAAGAGHAAVGTALTALEEYTRIHFDHEEELFDRTAYPHAAVHKRQHNRMRAKVADLHALWRKGALGAPSLKVITILTDWLFDHILGTDQQIVPYLHAASVA
ncbi:MAG: bacteriohemerythrin [Acidobacteriaceae bacterium]